MHVQIKLIDIFRDYLPPGSDPSNFVIDLQQKDMIQDVFRLLGIPDELPRVICCNGKTAQENQKLCKGDVVAIFSPMFGG